MSNMSNVNPFNVGVTGSAYLRNGTNEDVAKNPASEEKATEKTEKQFSSNEVLGFMAAQNADLVPTTATRTYNVSKYVSAEEAARIEDSILNGYIPTYESGYQATNEIAPDLSNKAKDEITLAYVNSLI